MALELIESNKYIDWWPKKIKLLQWWLCDAVKIQHSGEWYTGWSLCSYESDWCIFVKKTKKQTKTSFKRQDFFTMLSPHLYFSAEWYLSKVMTMYNDPYKDKALIYLGSGSLHLTICDPSLPTICYTNTQYVRLIKVADVASHPKNPLAEFVIVFPPDDLWGASEGHRHHAEKLTSRPGDWDGPESGAAYYIFHQGKVPHTQVLH